MAKDSDRDPKLFIPNHNIGRSLATFDLPELSSTSRRSSSRPSSPRTPQPTSRPSSPFFNFTPTSSARASPRGSAPGTPTPLEHQLLLPADDASSSPLVICFHGSGDSCRRSWRPLAHDLSHDYRVLLYERSPAGDVVSETNELAAYLAENSLKGPYVLLAHSHGGAFARCFLHFHQSDVAGMVLAETGQEATWDAKLQERQEEQHVLGERPLVVIKGRSLLRKWKQLEQDQADNKAREANGERVSESEKARLMVMTNEMRRWEKEDERLKKKQLKLSKRSKFVDLPDVGHHVIRDKPDRVIEEVKWVMDNLQGRGRLESRQDDDNEKTGEKKRNQSIPWLKRFGMTLTARDESEKRRSSR